MRFPGAAAAEDAPGAAPAPVGDLHRDGVPPQERDSRKQEAETMMTLMVVVVMVIPFLTAEHRSDARGGRPVDGTRNATAPPGK